MSLMLPTTPKFQSSNSSSPNAKRPKEESVCVPQILPKSSISDVVQVLPFYVSDFQSKTHSFIFFAGLLCVREMRTSSEEFGREGVFLDRFAVCSLRANVQRTLFRRLSVRSLRANIQRTHVSFFSSTFLHCFQSFDVPMLAHLFLLTLTQIWKVNSSTHIYQKLSNFNS